MKFIKKPVAIEAVRFEDSVECIDALGEDGLGLDPVRVDYADPDHPVLKIKTLEGEMTAQVGDYIIRGIKGEFYPCKPDIFAATYDEIEEMTPTLAEKEIEDLAFQLHEAGREAVEKGATVAHSLGDSKTFKFLEWTEITETAREGRRIQARYLLSRYDISPK